MDNQTARGAKFLFETNRQDKFTTRWRLKIIKNYALEAGIDKRPHPHLPRHQFFSEAMRCSRYTYIKGEAPRCGASPTIVRAGLVFEISRLSAATKPTVSTMTVSARTIVLVRITPGRPGPHSRAGYQSRKRMRSCIDDLLNCRTYPGNSFH